MLKNLFFLGMQTTRDRGKNNELRKRQGQELSRTYQIDLSCV